MTYTNRKLRVSKCKGEFLVHGQGTVLFKHADIKKTCCFRLMNKDKTQGIQFELGLCEIKAYLIPSNEPLFDKKNTQGLLEKKGVTYWLSLDSQNQKLYAGIGEARIENVLYRFSFVEQQKWEKLFLEGLCHFHIMSESTRTLLFLRDPITTCVPLLVKHTDELTMNDIAGTAVLPHSSLSPIAQRLFGCISGKRFVLDDTDFPEFSKAIEYSIINPNGWCYKRLLEKAGEFGKENIKETYLRITLGMNNGESPGIPYVMEIWPVGHYSPVHNHSGANAVIRVLHGSINVSLFPFLTEDGIDAFGSVDFKKDDITWISPTLNQTHQLKNLEDNTQACITIQCYMYDSDDSGHYDYFDYIEDGVKGQYEPDSDMDFLNFKKLMKEEWEASVQEDSIKKLSTVRRGW